MSGKKGSRYERELVNRFESVGWGALRCPSSGGGTDRQLPDVLAGKSVSRVPQWVEHDSGIIDPEVVETFTDSYAIELKSGKSTTLYVDREEVKSLKSFAQSFGATPLLGARFTTQASSTDVYLVKPEDARMTEKAYGLPISDIEDRAYMRVTKDSIELI